MNIVSNVCYKCLTTLSGKHLRLAILVVNQENDESVFLFQTSAVIIII